MSGVIFIHSYTWPWAIVMPKFFVFSKSSFPGSSDVKGTKINAFDTTSSPSSSVTIFLTCALEQLCPTQMTYWAKKYVTILTRAAHWKTYYRGPHIEWLTL